VLGLSNRNEITEGTAHGAGMKTLVLVRSGWPLVLRAAAYKAFRQMGLRILVVDRPENPGLQFADMAIVADLNRWPDILSAILDRISKGEVAGVVTFNDGAVGLTAWLANKLGLSGMDPEIAIAVADKLHQRRVLAKGGARVPEVRAVRTENEGLIAAEELGKCVVKPCDSTASGAVQAVEMPSEAPGAVRNARVRSPSGRVLVEQFLDGPELAVETLCWEGKRAIVGMTDTTTDGYPHFIEVAHAAPSRWTLHQAVRQEVLLAHELLGIDHGMTCIEVKITETGPAIVEVNPRPPGDCVMDLLSHTYGVDLYEVVARIACGETPSLIRSEPHGGAAVCFMLDRPGVVESISVGEPVLPVSPKWLLDFAVWIRRGMRLAAPSSNSGRGAYAIAQSMHGPSEALRLARLAISSIDVRISPETGHE
jgi:biotin carboxylase